MVRGLFAAATIAVAAVGAASAAEITTSPVTLIAVKKILTCDTRPRIARGTQHFPLLGGDQGDSMRLSNS